MQPKDPYEFITNPQKAPKPPLLAGNSKKARILIVAGGATLLLIVVLVVYSFISSAGRANQDQLLSVAQKQTELIRISKLATTRAKGTSAKNLALTVNLSLQSDQTALLTALRSQGVKPSAKDLAGGKNAKTDALLTSAEQANRFDDVFIQTVQAELATYQKAINQAYSGAESSKLKQALKAQYQNAGLLATAKQ